MKRSLMDLRLPVSVSNLIISFGVGFHDLGLILLVDDDEYILENIKSLDWGFGLNGFIRGSCLREIAIKERGIVEFVFDCGPVSATRWIFEEDIDCQV